MLLFSIIVVSDGDTNKSLLFSKQRPNSRSHGPSCVNTSVCYTFLSRHPFTNLFFDALKLILQMDKMVNVEHWSGMRHMVHAEGSHAIDHGHGKPSKDTVDFLNRFFLTPLPNRGKTLTINVRGNPNAFVDQKTLLEYARACNVPYEYGDSEEDKAILSWGCPVLFCALTIDRLVLLLGYALLEHKIVFCSKSEYSTSACVLAFEHLLRPLKWVCPFIPILPRKVVTCVEAPVPVLVGATSAPRGYLNDRPDVIVARLDEGTLVLPETAGSDGGVSSDMHLYRMPGCDQLCHELVHFFRTTGGVFSDDGCSKREIVRGNLAPSKSTIHTCLCMTDIIHKHIDEMVKWCIDGTYDGAGTEHPNNLFMKKFRTTQMMSHHMQMIKKGSDAEANTPNDFECTEIRTDSRNNNLSVADARECLLTTETPTAGKDPVGSCIGHILDDNSDDVHDEYNLYSDDEHEYSRGHTGLDRISLSSPARRARDERVIWRTSSNSEDDVDSDAT